MNYRQVACQQETMIGLENLLTMLTFLKKVWLWERNKDAWTRGQQWKQILIVPCWGAELEWVRVWCQKMLGCGKPLKLCWLTRIKAPSIFKISELRVNYFNEWKGSSDGENPRLGKGTFSKVASVTLAAGLGPSFPISYSASRFSGLVTVSSCCTKST